MRFLFIFVCIATISQAGCSQLALGTCKSDGDCKEGSTCDLTQDTPVCVVQAGGCFPACADGQSCVAGVCKANGCTPACAANQICDVDAGTCQTVVTPSVTITSPAAGTFASASISSSADAVAPAAVTAVRFELQRGGTAIATGNATAQPTSTDAARWSGSIDLSSLDGGSDGAAQLVAIATISGSSSSVKSSPVAVTVDQSPPSIAMVSDGRGAPALPGTVVQVKAQISDTGVGLAANATATLNFTGAPHAALTAAISSGVATFPVTVDDLLAPPDNNSVITFSISASDALGNSTTLAGDPKAIIKVFRSGPSGAIDAQPNWHSQADLIPVTGSISDSGGLVGGSTGVVLSHAGAMLCTATISLGGSTTAGTWSCNIDLSSQTFAAGSEGPFAITATLTDAAGNSTTTSGSLLVDNAAPQISNVVLLTGPTDPGSGTYAVSGGNLSVTAQIADSSGISAAYAGFQGQPPIAGTTLDGGAWSFSLPRPFGTFDGTVIPYSIIANDAFSDAGLPAPASAVHDATAVQPGLRFDNAPPMIAIPTDSRWFVRALPDGGASPLQIDATISDGTAVTATGLQAPKLTVSGGATVGPFFSSGNVYSFLIDPASVIGPGDAGTVAFSISAQDVLGNSASGSSSRKIDAAPPQLSGLQIYQSGGTPPGSGTTIAYPANGGSSFGHDGSHFIYNDTVIIAGTVSDVGAGAQAITLNINGTQVDGTAIPGQPISISCPQGQTGCSFNQPIALNAAGNGAFNTPIVDGGMPQGQMTVAVRVEDQALFPDGGLAHQGNGSSTPVNVTRFLWRQQLPRLNNTTNSQTRGIAGFALHPNGDLIVSGIASSTAQDTLLALHTSGPLADGGLNLDWSWGGNDATGGGTVGDGNDAPAIGAGDGQSALIYFTSVNAGNTGSLAAIQPDGGPVWKINAANTQFLTTPTVVAGTAQISGTATPVEQVLAVADTNTAGKLYSVFLPPSSTTPTVSSQNLGDSASTSPPMAFNSSAYLGTNDGVISRYSITDGGVVFNGSTATDAGGFWESMTDGTSLILPEASTDSTPTPIFKINVLTGTFTTLGRLNGVVANAVLDNANELYFPTGDDLFDGLNVLDGGVVTLRALTGGQDSVVGSNGHVYEPFLEGILIAFVNGAPSWSFSRDNAISQMATIDCAGILYVGSGSRIYAFVTDDKGLANSGWPTHRRDARATGNANAPLYGVFDGANCSQ